MAEQQPLIRDKGIETKRGCRDFPDSLLKEAYLRCMVTRYRPALMVSMDLQKIK
jgi:hypothetical protein